MAAMNLPTRAAGTLRLVSLNTWKGEGDYPARLRAMATALAALNADVIALQEDLCCEEGGLHTAGALARALGLHLSTVPARRKPRRINGRDQDSSSGLAVLSREPAREQRVLALPQDARDGERVVQCVRLTHGRGHWWLINLHLTHLSDRADLRRAQLDTVLGALGDAAGREAVVLCGDFNAAPGDPEIGAFLLPHGPLRDAFGDQPKATHRDSAGAAFNLDHIWVHTGREAPPPTVRHAAVVLDRPDASGVMPSDHCAVCADLVF